MGPLQKHLRAYKCNILKLWFEYMNIVQYMDYDILDGLSLTLKYMILYKIDFFRSSRTQENGFP